MKKISAIIVALLLISSLISVLAAPSPTTSATVGGITTETEDGEEIVIPKENTGVYVDITHVHEAEEGSELYDVAEQLKDGDKIDDKKLADVLGDEFENVKLIQLFSLETTSNIDGDNIVIGDISVNDDGTFTIENPKTVSAKGGKVVIKLDCPSVNENMNIRLVQKINGEWVQADHVRAFNGYVTFEFDLGEDFGTVWALTVDKAPVSPPTGDQNGIVYFAIFAIAVIGTVAVTRKYLAHR